MGAALTVLCFSRNRPLQLEAFLRSLQRSVSTAPAVVVLYRCDPAFDGAYAQLGRDRPDVRFVREEDFQAQVTDEVARARTPLFSFGCDDVLFRRGWDAALVDATFARLPALAGFSLRLGREIRHCQPLGRDFSQPRFEADPLLVWRWGLAEGDWALPFEVSATLYRIEWVRLVIELLAKRSRRWDHPNWLEAMGCKVAREEPAAARYPLLASYPAAVASTLTINRVQDVAEFPVYGGDDLSAAALLARFHDGERLDVEAYATRVYDRVHIGEALFRRG